MATRPELEQKIDIGRTIGRGFETIGHQFPAYLGLAIVLAGVPTFVNSYGLLGKTAESEMIGYFVSSGFWGSALVGMVGGALLQATVIRSAILTLNGRPTDVAGSLAGVLRLILPLVGLSILTSIIIGVGFLLLIVPGIIATIALSVAVPVLVEERTGVIDAMERSASLTKGSRWRIFLLLILFFFFYLLLAGALGGALMATGLEDSLAQPAGDALTATFTALLTAGMVASLYVELRTVKEGATTESLAAIFE